jgi:hypothetical protein
VDLGSREPAGLCGKSCGAKQLDEKSSVAKQVCYYIGYKDPHHLPPTQYHKS